MEEFELLLQVCYLTGRKCVCDELMCHNCDVDKALGRY
jgi:hypothetical protein